MTTSTRTKTTPKSTPTTGTKATPKATPAKPTPKAEVKPTPAPTAKPTTTYREVADFTPALKAAKSLSKGNADLSMPLQLITHLAWKTPGGAVGWAKGTTATVVAFADDLAVPTGTPISEAMDAALSAAEKGATDKPQKDAVAVLAKVIKAHG